MARRGLYLKNDCCREISAPKSEPPTAEKYRSEFRRDYARLVHSPIFRRLQGKTQLFPGEESDFFRNRLTHSLEVAQIAKSIAIKINATVPYFKHHNIDTDLVEFSGLAHDIGHPPFGHNGEYALDQLMINDGGYEGNAQTLRILSRIEKKVTQSFPYKSERPNPVEKATQTDARVGLNATFRTLASILKYDSKITPLKKERVTAGTEKKPIKGYYHLESNLVELIKENVRNDRGKKFKTIECQIMDISDDIAYSTYDIEDSFKAEFLSPIMMISMDKDFKGKIAKQVRGEIVAKYPEKQSGEQTFDVEDVDKILFELFDEILVPPEINRKALESGVGYHELSLLVTAPASYQSRQLGLNGYLRTQFTSDLVGQFIRNIEVNVDDKFPAMSSVKLKLSTFKVVETLKRFSFQLLIESPRLKLAERRGKEIINKVFNTLIDDSSLLPEDWRQLHDDFGDGSLKKRVVCDYIAGMTDRYCVEMYSRITGNNPISMWKPH